MNILFAHVIYSLKGILSRGSFFFKNELIRRKTSPTISGSIRPLLFHGFILFCQKSYSGKKSTKSDEHVAEKSPRGIVFAEWQWNEVSSEAEVITSTIHERNTYILPTHGVIMKRFRNTLSPLNPGKANFSLFWVDQSWGFARWIVQIVVAVVKWKQKFVCYTFTAKKSTNMRVNTKKIVWKTLKYRGPTSKR